jgi:hypothetical protein
MMMSVPLARIAPVKRWLMTFAACGALAAPCVAQDITIPTDVLTSLALGGQPSVGFNKGRPTVYSGFDVTNQRTRQFLFSSMGLNVQALLDEGILDVPHSRGSSFERGILAGGIGTALFYITIGRTASVSDVDFMARTSTLNKTDITLIYGGIAALHAFRISRDGRYANFFLRPNHLGASGLLVGVDIRPQ